MYGEDTVCLTGCKYTKKLWFNNLTLRHDRQNDRI